MKKRTRSILEELNNLHNSLLTTVQDKIYQEQYIKTKTNITEFIQKTDKQINNEVQACLVGLYGFLVLKLKGEKISEATQQAIQSFSAMMALLTDRYNKLQKGELKFSKAFSN